MTPNTAHAHDVHRRLLAHYGEPARQERRDPLTELVVTILSQNTADVNRDRAYRSLRARFASWEEVRAAPVAALEDAIRVAGLANTKAPRIHRILEDLHRERGSLDLDFLAEMSTEEAREYLLALHGVGPKTAACVLLFSLHKPALPVDTHVQRVSLRLGLVPPRTPPERTERLLEAALPPETYYAFHLNMIRHGRTLCTAARPRCSECPLLPICAYGASLGIAPAEAADDA
ncbi:MAG TPA: endonuclease III [Chloroflexi bacterium]|jgi:endonuclease-3|nr:endonuclease III [Chloroflexota bacterium]